MNTHDIELQKYGGDKNDDYVTGWNDCYAAIEADRTRRGEPVGYVMPTDMQKLRAGSHALIGPKSQGADIPLYLDPQPAETAKTDAVCQECGGDGAGGEHEDDCSQGEPVLDRANLVTDALSAPQPAEPTTDSLPRHVAQTLADAIYKAAQKMGIANGDHSTLSVPQCLHLLDCMSQPAEPVNVPVDKAGAVGHIFSLVRRLKNGEPVEDQLRQAIRGLAAEPVKVPSDEGIPVLISVLNAAVYKDDATDQATVHKSVLHKVIDLLHRYGQHAQPADKFRRGDRVRKLKGSNWQGRVVGTYSTILTPEGYAVESDTEHGSVQIYPAAALELFEGQPVEIAEQTADPDAERYRKFVGAGLPITYLGEDYRDKSGLDAAIDATGEP